LGMQRNDPTLVSSLPHACLPFLLKMMRKVAPVSADADTPEHTEDAKPERTKPAVRLSMPAAVCQLLTAKYMSLADDELSDRSLQENVSNNYVNVGVVAALLLSMVGITAGDVGESLVDSTNGAVSLETCQHVYTILQCLAFVLLINAVLISVQFYVMCSECTVKGEMRVWITTMGKYVNTHYTFMLFGMYAYVAGMVWLALTLLPLEVFIVLAVCLLVATMVSTCIQALGVQSLYKAKGSAGCTEV